MKSVTRTPWKSWSWVRRKDTDKVCPSVVVSQLEVKIRTVGGAVYGTFCFGFPWRHPPKQVGEIFLQGHDATDTGDASTVRHCCCRKSSVKASLFSVKDKLFYVGCLQDKIILIQ